ncbi:uncharacterized protein LOC123882277 [Trifolium pratense]|uniref:uncharacterized protein LOC123882277 n=1 Tax=Trifolium pratense TaxID=57577 RepID=UPI001E696D5E|nr:uncharacterized protein LOC123882277 [Trifolium pratense]
MCLNIMEDQTKELRKSCLRKLLMEKKSRSMLWLKKVKKEIWPWRFSAFRWKRLDHLQTTFMDNVVFRILSVAEVVVLVSTVCFFYLCCGCHF